MIGLFAIIVLGGLLALACWAFIWTYRNRRRHGKSDAVSFAWAVGAVVVLSLPITWDAIPTWIAFEYYTKKAAEVMVFKTLEQWKLENPSVAETLEPYGHGAKDKRDNSIKFSNGKSRTPMNKRFAYDSQLEKIFLSVTLARHEIVDTETGEVMFRWVTVGSGNSGGLASGGAGWWKPWLVHRSSPLERASMEASRATFEKFQYEFHYLRNK